MWYGIKILKIHLYEWQNMRWQGVESLAQTYKANWCGVITGTICDQVNGWVSLCGNNQLSLQPNKKKDGSPPK